MVSVHSDDHVFLGRYCSAVDEGNEEGWVALWAEDGVFTGIAPEPVVGHEALKLVPRDVREQGSGRRCRLVVNLHCDYIDSDASRVRARCDNSS